MNKKLKKWLPNHSTLQNHPHLKKFAHLLKEKKLWQWKRQSVARGVALGLFQMLWAALLAFLMQVNLPISVAMTWFNNPFTFIPVNIFMYKVGAWILHDPHQPPLIESLHGSSVLKELYIWIVSLGKPFALGVFVVAVGAAIIGYIIVNLAWNVGSLIKRK
jgi:uncharacterized protein (DUF2062 family)